MRIGEISGKLVFCTAQCHCHTTLGNSVYAIPKDKVSAHSMNFSKRVFSDESRGVAFVETLHRHPIWHRFSVVDCS
jgi:hypothetical protein